LGVIEERRVERRLGGRRRGVDEPRAELQLRRDVRGQQRDRVEAVRRVPLIRLVVALARVELGALDVAQRLQRLLREQLDPAARAPAQQMEALRLELLLEN